MKLGISSHAVCITQQKPSLHVTQRKPSLYVTQNKPTLHVTQRKPSLHVTQKKPSLHVNQKKPSLHVTQGKPCLHATQKKPSLHVNQKKPSLHVTQKKDAGVFRYENYFLDLQNQTNVIKLKAVMFYVSNPNHLQLVKQWLKAALLPNDKYSKWMDCSKKKKKMNRN